MYIITPDLSVACEELLNFKKDSLKLIANNLGGCDIVKEEGHNLFLFFITKSSK